MNQTLKGNRRSIPVDYQEEKCEVNTAHYSIMVVTKRKDLINHCCHPSARLGDSLPLEVPPAAKITAGKVDSASI